MTIYTADQCHRMTKSAARLHRFAHTRHAPGCDRSDEWGGCSYECTKARQRAGMKAYDIEDAVGQWLHLAGHLREYRPAMRLAVYASHIVG